MIGRTPENVVAIRPLKNGVISNFDITQTMIKKFIQKVTSKNTFGAPRIHTCYPSGITGVEKRALEDATKDSEDSEVLLLEEPMAATFQLMNL